MAKKKKKSAKKAVKKDVQKKEKSPFWQQIAAFTLILLAFFVFLGASGWAARMDQSGCLSKFDDCSA